MTGTERVRLQRGVTDLDLARFRPNADRCPATGIRLTPLSGLGDTPGNRRALYEPNKEWGRPRPRFPRRRPSLVRTVHRPADTRARAVNRTPGYVDADR